MNMLLNTISPRLAALRRILLAFTACMAIACAAAADTAPQTKPTAGVDYVVLPKPQQASRGNGIEVVQVFSYACGACARLEPDVEAWLNKRPRNVRFVQVPAAFGGAFDSAAKAYYAASELGVAAKTHAAIYRAVHVDQTLTGDEIDQVCDAYARLGVNRDDFRRAYESEKVANRVSWARSYTIAAGIDSTPTFVVAGKYKVSAGPSMPAEKILVTVDYLVGLERRASAAR